MENTNNTSEADAKQSSDTLQNLLTSNEAAKRLRISLRTLWTLTDSGELPCVRIIRGVRYSDRDVEAFINSHRDIGQRNSSYEAA